MDALIVKEGTAGGPMEMSELIKQVTLVQHVMKAVMRDGTHYGKVPGCGDKPSLLKPGAEKLAFVFRLAPHLDVTHRDLPNGHREYQVTCTLRHIGSNAIVAQGVGSCSSMESKYRFRTGPKKLTGQPVPKEYWNLRDSNPIRAQSFLGGPGYGTAKNDQGQWEIAEVGGKVEHDNPADYFNTVLKMAKKRAQVDAILTGTAASDIFTQDEEELAENLAAYSAESVVNGSTPKVPPATTTKAESPTPEARTDTPPAPAPAQGQPAAPAGDDWRSFEIPFGRAKGAKLGELPTNNLFWWIENYVAKPFGNATQPSKKDLAFRAALDQARDFYKAEKERQDAASEIDQTRAQRDQPPGDNIDEDVPF